MQISQHGCPLGRTNAVIVFNVTNLTTTNIVIRSASASCGCSVVSLPSKPWTLAPGQSGNITVRTDLRGKTGTLIKTVLVKMDGGLKVLTYTINIVAPLNPKEREKNLSLAQADRQAIFKGDCARCHAAPARGKSGKELYDAACGICHDAVHRATMVPDLWSTKTPRTTEYW
jgi:hypothetical protein